MKIQGCEKHDFRYRLSKYYVKQFYVYSKKHNEYYFNNITNSLNIKLNNNII